MNAPSFAGVGSYVRLIVRRDRLWLGILIVGTVLYVVAMALTVVTDYPTQDDRDQLVQAAIGNPVQIAMRGAIFGSDAGSLLTWSVQTAGSLILGIASLMLVLRHTRTDEAHGRAELIESYPLGRLAPLGAILLVLVAINFAFALILSMLLPVMGYPIKGSVALAFMLAGSGILLAAIAACLAQLTDNPKSARGLGLGLIGFFLLLRAGANLTGIDVLAWLTPLGWIEKVAAFSHDTIFWFVPVIVLSLTLVLMAFALRKARDLGAGLLPQRPGRAQAAGSLNSIWALSWRQHRMTMLAWSLGFFLFGLYMVPAIAGAEMQLGGPLLDFITAQGGDVDPDNLTDVFLNYLLNLASFIVGAVTIGVASRLRQDEASGTSELLLSTSVDRKRFAGSHALFVILTPAAILLALGLSAGISYGYLTTGVLDQMGRTLAATAVMVPATWVMGTITLLLVGLFPRLTPAAWAIWVVFLLIDLFHQAHPLLEGLLIIVPFVQAPWMLAGATVVWPLVVLLMISAGLLWCALQAFARRDLAA